MRSTGLVLAAVMALAAPVALGAAERATAIRAGELKQQPFIDAAGAGAVAANQAVSVVARQGGWVRVETNGGTGWMRMLNVRLDAESPAVAGNSAGAGGSAGQPRSVSRSSLTSPASLLHTGSSGKTVTTGIKGLDEADIRNASANPQQVEQLDTLAVDASEAAANAASSGLKEQHVEYLKKGRK